MPNEVAPASAVIACHTEERWPLLQRAIKSVLKQDPPPAEVVVVVDHNPVLLERVASAFPEVRALPNAQSPGASGARNTGAASLTSEFVAFLDDDAEAQPGWLQNLIQPLLDDAATVGTGGSATPDWANGQAPRWFPAPFGWVVGCTFEGQPLTDSRVRNVWAENMAVRRSAFAAVGGFKDGFGKLGSRSRPEDTELGIRLGQLGHWVYVPSARIAHYVGPDRSTFGFFLRRCFAEGAGKVDLARLVGRSEGLTDERDYARRVLPRSLAHNLRLAVTRADSGALLRALALCCGALAAAIGATIASLPSNERTAVH